MVMHRDFPVVPIAPLICTTVVPVSVVIGTTFMRIASPIKWVYANLGHSQVKIKPKQGHIKNFNVKSLRCRKLVGEGIGTGCEIACLQNNVGKQEKRRESIKHSSNRYHQIQQYI